ncbi:MAG: hypothetical protein R3C52_04845 [Hyphomonadaceae bacterium]
MQTASGKNRTGRTGKGVKVILLASLIVWGVSLAYDFSRPHSSLTGGGHAAAVERLVAES